MHLKQLYLHNFRTYQEVQCEFGPRINVIAGPNAYGKTSLLEAIYFCVTGRSFRGAQVSELIRHNTGHFYLYVDFVKNGLDQFLRLGCGTAERKFFYNSTPLSATSQLLGLVQGVVASPDDVALVKGAPILRRQYLDLQLVQIDPFYVHHLGRYTRALKQRNCLLRAKQVLTIESWEHEMAQSAAYLTKQRFKAVDDLQDSLGKIHSKLTGGNERLAIEYKSSADFGGLEEYFLSQYKKNRKRELDLGATLYGPHKDDLSISIDGKEARTYASEGQQRTCVLTLRCAEWNRLCSLAEEKPLMLVDDVAMGLDEQRKSRVLEYLSTLSQVFVTTTDRLLGERLDAKTINLQEITGQTA
jgi:DNA replication and repair protein RecF